MLNLIGSSYPHLKASGSESIDAWVGLHGVHLIYDIAFALPVFYSFLGYDLCTSTPEILTAALRVKRCT